VSDPPPSDPADRPRIRPSGAPEIPEILREKPADPGPARRKRRLTLMPTATTTEMRSIGVGLDFASMVAGGALLGWIAQTLTKWPHALLTGAIVGLVTGGYKLFQDAREINRDLTREEHHRKH